MCHPVKNVQEQLTAYQEGENELFRLNFPILMNVLDSSLLGQVARRYQLPLASEELGGRQLPVVLHRQAMSLTVLAWSNMK